MHQKETTRIPGEQIVVYWINICTSHPG